MINIITYQDQHGMVPSAEDVQRLLPPCYGQTEAVHNTGEGYPCVSVEGDQEAQRMEEDILWPVPVKSVTGTLYSIHYRDARERLHVMLTDAPDKETALAKVIAYQEERNGFNGEPTLDDVREVEWDTQDGESITLLYHADYD